MPVITHGTSKMLRLQCEDSSDSLIIRHTTRGDPYKEGIDIRIMCEGYGDCVDVSVMLEDREAVELRDLLIALYPTAK